MCIHSLWKLWTNNSENSSHLSWWVKIFGIRQGTTKEFDDIVWTINWDAQAPYSNVGLHQTFVLGFGLHPVNTIPQLFDRSYSENIYAYDLSQSLLQSFLIPNEVVRDDPTWRRERVCDLTFFSLFYCWLSLEKIVTNDSMNILIDWGGSKRSARLTKHQCCIFPLNC